MTIPPRWQLTRYGAVGLVTLAAYLGIAGIPQLRDAPLAWQAAIPFTAAVILNYLLQKYWVFRGLRDGWRSLPRYVAMITLGNLIHGAILGALAGSVPLLAARMCAVAMVVFSNAVLAFAWVYRPGR